MRRYATASAGELEEISMQCVTRVKVDVVIYIVHSAYCQDK